MSDRIEIRGIQFYGYHGVPETERAVGHRFAADVDLELDLAPAGEADDYARTVDYGAVAALVVEIGAGDSVSLVETLAERIAAATLERWPAVAAVTIAVRKLLPPVPHVVASAGVRIRRAREET